MKQCCTAQHRSIHFDSQMSGVVWSCADVEFATLPSVTIDVCDQILYCLKRPPDRIESLVCREDNIRQLRKLCSDAVTQQRSAFVYISGPPGCGKTESVRCLCSDATFLADETTHADNEDDDNDDNDNDDIEEEDSDDSDDFAVSGGAAPKRRRQQRRKPLLLRWIKCFDLQGNSVEQFYKQLLAGSGYAYTVAGFKNWIKQNYILLVLDELDQLADAQFRSFMDAIIVAEKHCSLLLIGIANQNNFIVKNLANVNTHNIPINHIHFRPYNEENIKDILRSRIGTVGKLYDVFAPDAIEFCAKKVVASSDMRVAIANCRKAIEILRDELSQGKARQHDANRRGLIKLTHMNALMQPSERHAMQATLTELTFQHRTVLCVLLQHPTASITVHTWFEKYRTAMKGQIAVLDRDKFKEVIERLEDSGAVGRSRASGAGGALPTLTWHDRISLAWRVSDLRALLAVDSSLVPFLS